MLLGILFALAAGLTLGLYALPEKFTKEYDFENTWGSFFFINMLIVPPLSAFLFVDGLGEIISSLSGTVLRGILIGGLLWGVGVMLWGKAINYVGVSLGFSIFIGTVILVGSLIPFAVNGLPDSNVLYPILLGLMLLLVGVGLNGKAGILRDGKSDTQEGTGNIVLGLSIAIIGGLLATGFSYANAVGGAEINMLNEQNGNDSWKASVVIMLLIYLAGSLFVIPYFIYQLSTKKNWNKFKTSSFGKNTYLTTIMAILNFAAGVFFAYSAFLLGEQGGTVGYAIYNALSVAVAIVSGIIVGEWSTASGKARQFLYGGLAAMILGVIVIAYGNSL